MGEKTITINKYDLAKAFIKVTGKDTNVGGLLSNAPILMLAFSVLEVELSKELFGEEESQNEEVSE